MHFLDILDIFRLDMGQISSNLLRKALAKWQYASLSISIAFYHIFVQACVVIKILRIWFFRRESEKFFESFFFRLSFLSFSFLLAAVIDVLLGLLPVQKSSRKPHRDRQFLPWSSHFLREMLLWVFYSNSWAFLCIFHALAWADHSDLGIIGKIYSSCRSWV